MYLRFSGKPVYLVLCFGGKGWIGLSPPQSRFDRGLDVACSLFGVCQYSPRPSIERIHGSCSPAIFQSTINIRREDIEPSIGSYRQGM